MDIILFQNRVGRTARGNNKGTALSLVAGKEKERADAVEAALSGGDESNNDQTTSVFKPYKFRMEELDGFRYRALDAWRSVTRIAIREARYYFLANRARFFKQTQIPNFFI